MKWIKSLLVLLVLAFFAFYFLGKENMSPNEAVDHFSHLIGNKKSDIKQKQIPEKKLLSKKYSGDLYHWLNKSSDELKEKYGKPTRKDLSSYGYTWWVYTDKKKQYKQFGVKDGKITSAFALGHGSSSEPVKIGQSYKEVEKTVSFSDEVSYDKGISSYQFLLNKEELKSRPLVKLSDNIFMQCYFDTFTNKLSAIRVIDGDTLLSQRPYELKYRGSLPGNEKLTDKQWKSVEVGMEQQIFDMTNILRAYYNKSALKWDEKVSNVAFLHSKDMAVNQYFSHYGQDGTGLKDRLAAKKVYYFAAGENIAAQYPDAPAAMQGWLNSKGHREALLNKDYTNLGVGVYKLYYTQNFLEKPM